MSPCTPADVEFFNRRLTIQRLDENERLSFTSCTSYVILLILLRTVATIWCELRTTKVRSNSRPGVDTVSTTAKHSRRPITNTNHRVLISLSDDVTTVNVSLRQPRPYDHPIHFVDGSQRAVYYSWSYLILAVYRSSV